MTDDLIRRLRGPLKYESLPPRQQEYLYLRARGLSMKDIAAVWGVSIQTVKNHSLKAHNLLGVNSCIEALIAIGWIVPQVPGVPSPE